MMDPIGLALENFDAIGLWRSAATAAAPSIRPASCTTARRSTARSACARRFSRTPTRSSTTFTENLLALRARPAARSPRHADGAGDHARGGAADDNRFSSFVLGVVKSVPFQMRQGRRRGHDRGPAGAGQVANQRRTLMIRHVHHQKALVAAHGAARHGRGRRAAVPRGDGAGADAAAQAPRRRRGRGWCASRWCTARAGSTQDGMDKNYWMPAKEGARLRLHDDPEAARAVPRLRHGRHADRSARRRSLVGGRRGRRPLPLERRVPDGGAPEADRRLGRRAPAPRSIRSTRSSSARTRRCRRSSSASRTSTPRAPAASTTPASTPVRSAGRRRRRRCR